MVAGLTLTGGTSREMMEEGRRLNDAMGAVNILPQLLASLGVVFTAAKVGDLIAGGIQRIIPDNSLFPLVLANCVGMTLFTLVMGSVFGTVFGPRTYSIVNISHKICNGWSSNRPNRARPVEVAFARGKACTCSLFGPAKQRLWSGLLAAYSAVYL
jgi:hypothetical protein